MATGEGFGAAPAGKCLDEVRVFDALVVAAVGVAAQIGELVVVLVELLFGVGVHLGRRIAFGVEVGIDRAERLTDRLRSGAFRGDHD